MMICTSSLPRCVVHVNPIWMNIKTKIDGAIAYCHRLRNRSIRPSRHRIRAALASSQWRASFPFPKSNPHNHVWNFRKVWWVWLGAKAAYASQILYAISLCLAKLTILHFLRTFARLKTRRSIIHGVMVFQVMTTIAAIFSIAFQCSLPDPWKVHSSKCLDQVS